MAFPTVETTNSTQATTDGNSQASINLPSGISADDVLIVAVAFEEFTSDDIQWPAGWTELYDVNEGSTTGQDHSQAAAYRKADGGEGSTITVTYGNWDFVDVCGISYRISGAEDPSTQAPEASTSATGNDASADPASLTPTGGAKDYLWLALATWDDNTGTDASSAPSSYSNLLTTNDTSDTGIAGAERQLNASSEDPGTFTNPNARWIAVTVAVHPASVVSNARMADLAFCRGTVPFGVGRLPIPDGTID